MPFGIKRKGGKVVVYNRDTGRVLGTHDSADDAKAQLTAVNINYYGDKEKEATLQDPLAADYKTPAPPGDLKAAYRTLWNDVSSGFDPVGKWDYLKRYAKSADMSEMKPTVEHVKDPMTAASLITGLLAGGAYGYGSEGSKRKRLLKALLFGAGGATAGYAAARASHVFKDPGDAEVPTADSKMVFKMMPKKSSLEAVMETATAGDDQRLMTAIGNSKKRRKPSPWMAMSALAGGAGLYGASKAIVTDADAQKLDDFASLINKNNKEMEPTPEWLMQYEDRASTAANAKVLGVPIYKINPSLWHIIGGSVNDDNYPGVKDHYDDYAKGPMHAMLHDLGDYANPASDRHDRNKPVIPNLYPTFAKWIAGRVPNDPFLNSDARHELVGKTPEQIQEILNAPVGSDTELNRGVQSHLTRAFIADATRGAIPGLTAEQAQSAIKSIGFGHMDVFRDQYYPAIKNGLFYGKQLPKTLGIAAGGIGAVLLGKYLYDRIAFQNAQEERKKKMRMIKTAARMLS